MAAGTTSFEPDFFSSLLEIVTPKLGWAYGERDTWDLLQATLESSLTEVTSPAHSILREQGVRLVTGQNMDAALSINMNKPDQIRGLLPSPSHMIEVCKNRDYAMLLNGKLPSGFSKMHLAALALNLVQAVRGRPAITDLQEDLLQKKQDLIFKRAVPNEFGSELRDMRLAELRYLEKMLPENAPLKQAYYYCYPALKSILARGIFNHPPIHFPSFSSFSSIWSQRMSARDVLRPKWQVEGFIEKLSGVDFNSLRFNANNFQATGAPIGTQFATLELGNVWIEALS